ncbi:3-deoxy-D-manno-octulosonate-8-phosphate synthase [Syntrophotalea carbinolica DSM 2380]|uniref:2-dehydro-3-deoxyphosphooctonate aldolase n=1 Tax=Syntrophotalea carbinolica (strain DSM 2380 / NBRC 103641 / GraBd1) TaxID=338963 RepID=KDSA_SYNC1|nr:3-deoxy-8-phosphooctulonate synthase [Syntrophotalea carbinolica]Q3A372.1 RecName: Full=2-dehydro-3-deoxyphosphooctonate aldolase; AltName: Full=3-deoxy-D-manno-octulosonic acid 8-phosphate synthase; AltName: Full=KDO-8-phosphate synthase; Short=KDO 8-P synthase; Short=KDOPS; AltName: Full=Phospho-2-dehydro-3-deoxyoctonate aldolase [Syntrophotalea carbinolica DSM 2380]ABA89185.1 3-deoxy-D-manno-octulosonate-8-phosphate synthase [Syntrophotalea carbinolica DSM 2380]
MPDTLKVADVTFGGNHPVALIAGPCVMENEAHTLAIARQLLEVKNELGVGVVFKASFDKANRTSVSAYRGPGLESGLRILDKVRQQTGLPIVSDIHDVSQVEAAAEVLDILQIPAFLCRQTDLLLAAGRSGKVVNIKKGQFLAPWDMANAVAKVASTGNDRILLTERGTSFGYNNLVVDMRSLAVMRELGCPVVFDATHAVQLPGGAGTSSGGQRQFVAALSRAAVAVGVDGLFWEVHPDPDRALCDGANSLPLDQVKKTLKEMMAIDAIVKGNTES